MLSCKGLLFIHGVSKIGAIFLLRLPKPNAETMILELVNFRHWSAEERNSMRALKVTPKSTKDASKESTPAYLTVVDLCSLYNGDKHFCGWLCDLLYPIECDGSDIVLGLVQALRR